MVTNMQAIRKGVFETNSSSSHSLPYKHNIVEMFDDIRRMVND